MWLVLPTRCLFCTGLNGFLTEQFQHEQMFVPIAVRETGRLHGAVVAVYGMLVGLCVGAPEVNR